MTTTLSLLEHPCRLLYSKCSKLFFFQVIKGWTITPAHLSSLTYWTSKDIGKYVYLSLLLRRPLQSLYEESFFLDPKAFTDSHSTVNSTVAMYRRHGFRWQEDNKNTACYRRERMPQATEHNDVVEQRLSFRGNVRQSVIIWSAA
jgi:hypothetical protein